jgi:ketol-acid reductoisomerase
LDNGKAIWLGTNPIDDALNLELLHEHMFFDDGTNENIGFGPSGRFRDDNPELKGYHYEEKYYDDKLMREALKNVIDGKYSKLFNNCQDWAEKARNEYQKLYDNLPVEEKAKVDHNVRVLEIKNTIIKLLKSDKENEE